jgi:formate hydrogenlyase transcriptional activator
MRAESLLSLAVDVAGEQSLQGVLTAIVHGLAAQPDVALARIWLLLPVGLCDDCVNPTACREHTQCLQLVASAGTPLNSPGEDWSLLRGYFRRVPLNAWKVGVIGATGTSILIKDVAAENAWIARADWAAREGIRSFAGHPLVFRGKGLGVLALFSRQLIDDSGFGWLRIFADQAAVAITNARTIEDRVRAEAALREREVELRRLVDAVPQHILVLRSDGGRLHANQGMLDYHGVALDDVQWDDFLAKVCHPDDVDRVTETRARGIARGTPWETEARICGKDGQYRWFLNRFNPLRDEEGRIIRWYGTRTDIEDRKRAEEDLRRSETYLAEAQRLSLTGSFGWKVSSGELFWSEETFRILGYDQGTKPTLESVFRQVHPEDRAFVRQTVGRASRDGTDLDLEHRLLMPDGSVKHVHVVAHAVRDEVDTLEFVGAVSDVTTAKAAEERIRQDERELRQIVEAIPALILILTPNGSPLYANERLLEYTGLTFEDVQAGDFRERVFHPSDVERVRDERQEKLARGVPFQLEQRARAKDGRYRWFLIHYSPLRDEQGQVIRWYATGTDIDERKRAEESAQRENMALREEIDKTSMFEEIVGASPALQVLLSRVAKVAPTDSTVLITGETGTGKELIARAIHKRSPRASRAFVSVNCAAVPPALIASELFGHEKGAFTGAHQRRLGRFELAEGGTLFLDEIGELLTETQIALLRVLQEHEFERVGGTHAIRADVRVIAAANRDLHAAIAAGTFRRDLFYRLNVFPIEMPPLRDRKEDIPLLVEYFVGRYAKKAGKKIRSVSKRTLDLLQAYPWPGNIRELQNVIERSVIVCETDTFSVDKSWLSREAPPPRPTNQTLSKRPTEQEKELIEAALAETRGRVAGPSGAAAKLGLPPSTLESKIRSLKINKHRFKAA